MASKIIKQEKFKKEAKIIQLIRDHSFKIFKDACRYNSDIRRLDKLTEYDSKLYNSLMKEINMNDAFSGKKLRK